MRQLGLNPGKFEDALRHRNEARREMEIFSTYDFEFRQPCLASEIKYMGESLASAARIMSEESSDEGSTSRIVELGLVVATSLLRMEHDTLFMKVRAHGNDTTLTRQCSSSHTQEQHHNAKMAEQFRQQRGRLQQCKIMCSLFTPHSMAFEAWMKRTNRDEKTFHFHCTSCEHHLNCTDRQGPFGLEKKQRRFARLLRMVASLTKK